jgi:hypothetical protein
MLLVIHQPEYLPWLGYFERLINCDLLVVLDHVQMEKGGWINRNKIKTSTGWQWLTVPIRHDKSLPMINQVRINNDTDWKDKQWKSLSTNYGRAPYFERYGSLLKNVYNREWTYQAELDVFLIQELMRMLGLEVPILMSSSMTVEGTRNDLLINICKAVGADIYLSGMGAKGYMDLEKFSNEQIKVVFQDFKHPQYAQQFEKAGFQPYMSIVDLLFNCGPDSLDIIKSVSTTVEL